MDPTGAEEAVDEKNEEGMEKVDGVAVPIDGPENFGCVAVLQDVPISKRERSENRVDAVEHMKRLQPRCLVDGSAV